MGDGSFDETYSHYCFLMKETINPLYLTFPSLERLPTRRNRRYRAGFQHMHGVLQSAVDARLEERARLQAEGNLSEEPKDMLDLLLGKGMNRHGVLEEGHLLPILWIFFIAGHDTTAISLTWLMHFLAQHQDVQARAREEAIGVLDGAKAPTAKQLDEVPYISAIVNEGLRLRPPVYNLLTREAAHDTELDGVMLPKGTIISIHINAVNQHPDVWDRPTEFDPERFLQTKQPRVFNNLPFSAGPRRCLGDKFSLMEQKTLLIMLLSQLEILPDAGSTAHHDSIPFAADSMALLFLQPKDMKIQVRPL